MSKLSPTFVDAYIGFVAGYAYCTLSTAFYRSDDMVRAFAATTVYVAISSGVLYLYARWKRQDGSARINLWW
jgi:hypothetical protein